MGRYNFTALRVRQRAIRNLETVQTTKKPIWLDVLGKIPPAQVFVRQLPQKHPDVRRRIRTSIPAAADTPILPDGEPEPQTTYEEYEVVSRREQKTIFKPRQIRFQEDELRTRFYKDHPWELARPRMLVENTGQDHAQCDWSTGILQHQKGKKLDGESVVQRQIWLLEHVPNMTTDNAYDTARREFYDARHQEDVERRVAAEEAGYVGAQFEPDVIHWGMTVEDKAYDAWEAWAQQQVIEKDQKRAAFSGGNTIAVVDSTEAPELDDQDVASEDGSLKEGPETGLGTENNGRSPSALGFGL